MEIKLELANLEEVEKLISLLTQIRPSLETDKKGLELIEKLEKLALEIKEKPEQAKPDKKKGVPDRILRRALELIND